MPQLSLRASWSLAAAVIALLTPSVSRAVIDMNDGARASVEVVVIVLLHNSPITGQAGLYKQHKQRSTLQLPPRGPQASVVTNTQWSQEPSGAVTEPSVTTNTSHTKHKETLL